MPDLDRAAEVIRHCWTHGDAIDYVKGDLWPDTVEEGYAVQELIAKMRDEPVKGWKIAATAIAGRTHINVDQPLAGRLFPSMCFSNNAKVPFGKNRMAVAEVEFVFTLGKDLPPKATAYTSDEVASCIQSLHPGLELPDSRFRDFTLPGTAGLIADNACASKFVLGDATTVDFDPRALAKHPTSLLINNELATTGHGADALEGPLSALVWLANNLNSMNTGLSAGQFITTGVTGLPTAIKQGDTVHADLGLYGSVTATLT